MVCFLGTCVPVVKTRIYFKRAKDLFCFGIFPVQYIAIRSLFLTHYTSFYLFVLLFYFNDSQNHLTHTYGSAYFVGLGVKQAASIY